MIYRTACRSQFCKYYLIYL